MKEITDKKGEQLSSPKTKGTWKFGGNKLQYKYNALKMLVKELRMKYIGKSGEYNTYEMSDEHLINAIKKLANEYTSQLKMGIDVSKSQYKNLANIVFEAEMRELSGYVKDLKRLMAEKERYEKSKSTGRRIGRKKHSVA